MRSSTGLQPPRWRQGGGGGSNQAQALAMPCNLDERGPLRVGDVWGVIGAVMPEPIRRSGFGAGVPL